MSYKEYKEMIKYEVLADLIENVAMIVYVIGSFGLVMTGAIFVMVGKDLIGITVIVSSLLVTIPLFVLNEIADIYKNKARNLEKKLNR